MRYSDGQLILVGDRVTFNRVQTGTVVASFDSGEFSERCPKAEWSHLERGIMVDTSFGGLVWYEDAPEPEMELFERGAK